MARGQGSGDANLKLFFMKITGLKKGEKAVIEQSEARGEKQIVKLDEKLSFVKGKLEKVEIREYTYEGEQVKDLRVWLKDSLDGEMYIVSCGLNSIGRSILNTLLNLEKPYGELEIRVYNKKDTGYAAAYIEHNGVKAGWKYTIDQMKPFIKENSISRKGQVVVERDYFALDTKLIDELKAEVMPSLNKVPAHFSGVEAKAPAQESDLAPVGADEDSGLPF